MAGITVSGASIGLVAAQPAGLTPASTNAERVTAYEAMSASMVKPASCIITKLPMFDEFWETNQDPDTVCDDENQIRKSFKTIAAIAPTSMEAIFEKTDPIIVLFNALRISRSDIGTLEITHSNGTDKIWAQIQVSKTTEDLTDNLGKVKFMVEMFFEERPVRN